MERNTVQVILAHYQYQLDKPTQVKLEEVLKDGEKIWDLMILISHALEVYQMH